MGTIKLDKDEMLKEAKELSVLKDQINNILNKTQETENVLRRETSVSTYSVRNKLTSVQDLTYNLVREFDKISDNFYAAARAYESTEDKLNNLVNINKDSNFGNIIAVNSMENTYFNSDNTKSEEKEEAAFDKLRELIQEGWSFVKGYFELNISAIDFMKDVCDNINTFIDGYLENNKEFIAEFNAEHPRLSILFKPLEQTLGMFDGALMFVKEMTFGLGSDVLGMLSYEYHGLLENPEETLSENLKTLNMLRAIVCPMTKEEQEIQSQVLSGIWNEIKTSINTNLINGNPYTASRFVTDIALNIGSLFFGAGELKAAANVKKADNVIDGMRVLDKVSDAGKVEKSISITAKIERKVSNALSDIIHTKKDSLFEYVKQTKDLGSEISLELRNKIFGVKEVRISKSKLTPAEINGALAGCFTGDTLVFTEDGFKKIKDINEGDFVYSRNEESGQVSLKKVIYTYIKEAKDFIKLKLGVSEIECTPNHLFMLEDGAWKSAEHLSVGNKIINIDGSVIAVEGIEPLSYNEGKAIYNLNVEDNHTYFVSEEKVCVHNDCMVTPEGIERVFNAIPKGTPKNISWNEFQALMKGNGNTAEKAAAYSKFSKKEVSNVNKGFDGKIKTVKDELAGKSKIELQNIADNAAKNYNARYTPVERAISKGYYGVEKTLNGGISFRNSDYIHTINGKNTWTVMEATGSRTSDFDFANRMFGFKTTPEGYVWHHVDDYNVFDNTFTIELVKKDAHNASKAHSGACAQYDSVHGPNYNPKRKGR